MSIVDMLQMIYDSGWSQPRIAERVGVAASQISRYFTGREPGYSVGKKIEELYAEVIADDDDAATDIAEEDVA